MKVLGLLKTAFYGICVCLILGINSGKAADSTMLARYFPADTILYMVEENVSADSKGWKDTAFGKILLEKEVQEFFAESKVKLTQALGMTDGFLTRQGSQLKTKELLSIFKKRIAIGIQIDVGNKVFGIKGIAELKDSDSAKALINNLLTDIKRNAPPQLQQNWDLEPNSTIIIRSKKLFIALKNQGNLLMFSIGNKEAQVVAFLNSDDQKSLLTSDGYIKATKAIGQGSKNLAFINIKRAWDIFNNLPIKDSEEFTKIKAVAEALGLTDINTLACNIKVSGSGFESRNWIGIDYSKTKNLSTKMAWKVDKDLLNCIPADATGFNARKIELSKLSSQLRKAALAGGVKEDTINLMIQMATANIGFNPEEDLLKCLDDEMVTISLNPESIGGLPFFGLNSFAAVFKINNKTKIQDALAKGFTIGGDAMAKSKIGGGLLTKTHNGVIISGVRIGNIITPSIGIVDKYLIVAAGPQGVSLIIDTINGKAKRITDNSNFKHAISKVKDKIGFEMSYSKRPHLTIATGGGLTGISGMSMMAGMLLPALQNSRQAANKSKCLNNMKQIGTCIALYSHDTRYGKMPATLQNLYQDKNGTDGEGIVGDIRLFTCPESGGGYIYIGKEAASIIGPSHIIAWDAKQHSDGTRCVLYRDGHAKVLNNSRFSEEIKTVSTYLQNKGVTFKPAPSFGGKKIAHIANNPITAFTQKIFAGIPGQQQKLIKTFLNTFKFYKLPSANCINRHLYPEIKTGRITKDGIITIIHRPLPFSVGQSSSLISPTTISIIAAIAIPNLLEAKRHR